MASAHAANGIRSRKQVRITGTDYDTFEQSDQDRSQGEQGIQQEQARIKPSTFSDGMEGDEGTFLNEEALLAQSTFPIKPDELIAKARKVIQIGVHKARDQLADDFTFSAPFVGPLDADSFASVMETLNLDEVFPDLAARVYHMRVDILEPNRVWFTSRPVGHHRGHFKAGMPMGYLKAPTHKRVELPAQTSSLSFNEEGKVTDFTYGYVMDRRLGNSDGLGGAFGLLWAIGCPFPYPEGRPWSSSLQQRMFNSSWKVLKVLAVAIDRVAGTLLPNFLYTAHSRNVN